MTNDEKRGEKKSDVPPSLDPPELPKFFRVRKNRLGAEQNIWLLASSIGLSLVVAIVLGLAGGYWLDGFFGTKPWLTMIGTLLGVVAGFRNLFIISGRIDRKSRELADEKRARQADALRRELEKEREKDRGKHE